MVQVLASQSSFTAIYCPFCTSVYVVALNVYRVLRTASFLHKDLEKGVKD